MIRIYIIRHGETDSNKRAACVGSTNVPLNDVGRQQACELCARLDNIRPDVIYVSPLSRAADTIKPFCTRHPGIPVITEPAIRERDFGEWEDMSFEEISVADPERYAKWQSDFIGYTVPGGESSCQVQQRVNKLIDSILSEGDGKIYFLVTHLGTARHLISRCLELATEQSWLFTLENASMAVIDIENGCGVLKYLNV